MGRRYSWRYSWSMVAATHVCRMWNKIAILRHMFDQMPDTNPNEWLMWVDLDALILNTTFRIPFEVSGIAGSIACGFTIVHGA
jgi:hypothetical protein